MRQVNATRGAQVALISLALACAGTQSAEPATPTEAAPLELSPAVEHARVEAGAHALLRQPVTSFGAAAIGEHLYVVGGYAGVPHQYSMEGQSRAVGRFDMRTGAYEDLSPLPYGVQSVALAAHGRTVIRVGGLRAMNHHGDEAELVSIADVARFDAATGEWSDLPPLPEPRSSHMAAVVGDTLYVAGGWNLQREVSDAEWATTLLSLDLTNPNAGWRSVDAPLRSRGIAVAAVGSKLAVLGGMGPSGGFQSEVRLFDPATLQWSDAPAFPGTPFGMAAVALGDSLVATGADGRVYTWREGGAWEAQNELLFPRFFHQLAAVGERVFAIGGTSGMGAADRTPHVEQVYPPAQSVLVDVDYPGQARNRQGMIIMDDWLYVFGGNNSLGQHDFEPENFVADAHRLHLPSLRWERIADYPVNRQTMSVAAVGEGRFVSVGGFGVGEGEAETHADSYVYDVEANTWAAAPALTQGRSQFELVTGPNGRLWVFGGLNYDPTQEGMAAFSHLQTVETLDAELTGFSVSDITLPGPRRAFGGAVHGGRFLMIGGMRENFQLVDGCASFTFETGEFGEVACPEGPRLSPQLVPGEDKVILLGGSLVDGREVTGTRAVEVYDPAVNAWTAHSAELPFDPKHVRAFPYRGRVLVVTTHDAPEGHMRLFVITP